MYNEDYKSESFIKFKLNHSVDTIKQQKKIIFYLVSSVNCPCPF